VFYSHHLILFYFYNFVLIVNSINVTLLCNVLCLSSAVRIKKNNVNLLLITERICCQFLVVSIIAVWAVYLALRTLFFICSIFCCSHAFCTLLIYYELYREEVSVIITEEIVFSARCNLYISRLCYDVSVRLSVRLSVCDGSALAHYS